MVRGGDPDALDSIVPMAYESSLDLVLKGVHGRIVVLKNEDTIICNRRGNFI